MTAQSPLSTSLRAAPLGGRPQDRSAPWPCPQGLIRLLRHCCCGRLLRTGEVEEERRGDAWSRRLEATIRSKPLRSIADPRGMVRLDRVGAVSGCAGWVPVSYTHLT